MSIFNLLIFFALAVVGYKIFEKLKLPTPFLLGSMAAIGVAGIAGLELTLPVLFRPAVSALLGILLGLKFSVKFKEIWIEATLFLLWLVATSAGTSTVLRLMGVNETTAVFSAMPGGLAEVTLVAMSFGANTFEVTVMQLSRVIVGCTAFPAAIKRMERGKDTGAVPARDEVVPVSALDWTLLILFAALGALACWALNIPAPYLMGPLVTSCVYTKLRGLHAPPYKKVQDWALLGIGGLVGLNITRSSVAAMPRMLLPILVLNICLTGMALLFSVLLHKARGWDVATSVMAVSPGGLAPIISLAMDMNADVTKVAVFQLLRVISVVLLSPFLGGLLL